MAPSRLRAVRLGVLAAAWVAASACSTAGGEQASPTLEVFAPALTSPTPPAPTPAGPAPSIPECTNDARFVEDLTVPDGERVGRGQTIDKRWSVQNTGTCDWGPEYRLVKISGDVFAGPDEIALYPAQAGSEAVWQVLLEAPEFLGEYSSRWQAQAPDGSRFGDDVFVVIVVTGE